MTGLLQLPAADEFRMPDDVALKALAIARVIALRQHSRRLIRRSEIDDFAGDLVAHAVRCWPKYNRGKASAVTFLSFAMRLAAISLLRARHSAKRGQRRCVRLTDVESGDGQTPDTHMCMAVSAIHIHSVDLRLDLELVRAQLSDELDAYCALLEIMTPHEVVQLLRVSRYHVAARVCEMHQQFEAAGLREYLRGVNQAKGMRSQEKPQIFRQPARRLRK